MKYLSKEDLKPGKEWTVQYVFVDIKRFSYKFILNSINGFKNFKKFEIFNKPKIQRRIKYFL